MQSFIHQSDHLPAAGYRPGTECGSVHIGELAISGSGRPDKHGVNKCSFLRFHGKFVHHILGLINLVPH